ncbi:MAG: hypothetical protein ACWA5U_10575 [bacterium]
MQCSCEHNPNYPSLMADRLQGQQVTEHQNGQQVGVDPVAKNEFDRMMDAPSEASSAGQSDASNSGEDGQTMQQLLLQLLPLILQLILSLGENGTSTSGNGSTDGNTLIDGQAGSNNAEPNAGLNPAQYV